LGEWLVTVSWRYFFSEEDEAAGAGAGAGAAAGAGVEAAGVALSGLGAELLLSPEAGFGFELP
jgi:hypothetical protein